MFAYLGSVCNSASEKNSQYCYKMYDTSRLNLTALEIQGVTNFTEEKVQNMVMVLDSIYYGTPFMFGILSVIYFFSFCTSMLYYLGALQWVVLKLGWLLRAESFLVWFRKKLISQNWFLKFKHLNWVIAKLILILANQIAH